MLRIALGFGAALGAAALLISWMDFRVISHAWSIELYGVCIALSFALLGLWLGNRLTPRPRPSGFVPNEKARAYLAISEREFEVLELIAAGHSNKVIARRLAISPNTVKTHVARLFEKLEVTSRTQAIGRARELSMLP